MDFRTARRLTFADKRAVKIDIGGTTVWNGLPKGYEEIDYIETTGTQYIDTGISPNQDTRIVCLFMSKNARDLYGSRVTTSSNNFNVREVGTPKCYQHCYGSNLFTTTIQVDATKWQLIDQNKNRIFIDGVEGFDSDGNRLEYGATFNPERTITLGGIHAGSKGSAGSVYYGKGRYRNCQIYDDGKLVRNFVPCKNLDGAIGMFDTVNGVFYGNSGSGNFVEGPAWNGLPKGYKQLDYIESDASEGTDKTGSCIDTGVEANQNSRIICEFMCLADDSEVYGARSTTSSNNFNLRISSDKWQPGYGSLGNTGVLWDTEWHTADHNRNVFNLYTTIDGSTEVTASYTFDEVTFKAPKSIMIGAINANNRVYYGKARFRSCQIYVDDVLVRDYIPCKDSNGNIGMYDKLNAKFYNNAGTNNFIAGAEL